MPIITVARDNDKVTVCIGTDLVYSCDGKSTTRLPFEWRVTQPYIADLVTRYIQERIETAVSEARQEAYEQGWKDAKGKKPKADWFSGAL